MAKPAPSKAKEQSRSDDNLEQITLRVHPDILRAIEKKAASERRKKADVIREMLAKGVQAEGLYL